MVKNCVLSVRNIFTPYMHYDNFFLFNLLFFYSLEIYCNWREMLCCLCIFLPCVIFMPLRAFILLCILCSFLRFSDSNNYTNFYVVDWLFRSFPLSFMPWRRSLLFNILWDHKQIQETSIRWSNGSSLRWHKVWFTSLLIIAVSTLQWH